MKKYLIVLVSVLASSTLIAQQVYKSETYKISFVSPEKLEFFQEEASPLFGYYNDHYMVMIQAIPLAEESKKFVKDPAYGAKEIATDMGFKSITNGGKIPAIDASYYVSARNPGEQDIPVFVAAILNHDTKTAFEVTVYCYNLNKTEGEKMVKSFQLLK